MIKMFAIYQIMLGWEAYRYYYETVELPNPRPTLPKKKWVMCGIWAAFSPQRIIFRGLGLFYMGNSLQEALPNQILGQHPDDLLIHYIGIYTV